MLGKRTETACHDHYRRDENESRVTGSMILAGSGLGTTFFKTRPDVVIRLSEDQRSHLL